MLIKSMDDRAGEIADLERAIEALQDDAKRRATSDLRQPSPSERSRQVLRVQ